MTQFSNTELSHFLFENALAETKLIEKVRESLPGEQAERAALAIKSRVAMFEAAAAIVASSEEAKASAASESCPAGGSPQESSSAPAASP